MKNILNLVKFLTLSFIVSTNLVFAENNKIQFKNYTCFGRDLVWEVFLANESNEQNYIAVTIKDTFQMRGTTYLVHNISKTQDHKNSCLLSLQYKTLGQSMELSLDNCSNKYNYKSTLGNATSTESILCQSP